jgi:hypothetical protein
MQLGDPRLDVPPRALLAPQVEAVRQEKFRRLGLGIDLVRALGCCFWLASCIYQSPSPVASSLFCGAAR